jgi:hypothetical protein
MSSFEAPHHLFVFDLKNGKKKMAYGKTPEDALEILSFRLGQDEMDEILRDRFVKINQRRIREFLPELG